MVFSNYGKQAVAWAIGSDISNNNVQAIAIGSGSGTALVTDVTLLNEVKKTVITGSPDFDTARKVSFQADFNSITMSGIILTEFGLFVSGPSLVGSTWQRESFGSLVFDGTNELQIVSIIDVL